MWDLPFNGLQNKKIYLISLTKHALNSKKKEKKEKKKKEVNSHFPIFHILFFNFLKSNMFIIFLQLFLKKKKEKEKEKG